jgi:aryl-alcohol dehydrogenase-like predicted oxidoreductase
LSGLADKAGITLVELAVAFVLEHPAISSAIIGPRTMEQLETQLGAPDVSLSAETLDAIDELVPPGTNIVHGEVGYAPPALTDVKRRRRSA